MTDSRDRYGLSSFLDGLEFPKIHLSRFPVIAGDRLERAPMGQQFVLFPFERQQELAVLVRREHVVLAVRSEEHEQFVAFHACPANQIARGLKSLALDHRDQTVVGLEDLDLVIDGDRRSARRLSARFLKFVAAGPAFLRERGHGAQQRQDRKFQDRRSADASVHFRGQFAARIE